MYQTPLLGASFGPRVPGFYQKITAYKNELLSTSPKSSGVIKTEVKKNSQ
jgi:hypothetical protein